MYNTGGHLNLTVPTHPCPPRRTSDLVVAARRDGRPARTVVVPVERRGDFEALQLLSAKPVLYVCNVDEDAAATGNAHTAAVARMAADQGAATVVVSAAIRSEEHTSELQSLMRISSAVFCLKKKKH